VRSDSPETSDWVTSIAEADSPETSSSPETEKDPSLPAVAVRITRDPTRTVTWAPAFALDPEIVKRPRMLPLTSAMMESTATGSGITASPATTGSDSAAISLSCTMDIVVRPLPSLVDRTTNVPSALTIDAPRMVVPLASSRTVRPATLLPRIVAMLSCTTNVVSLG
jgi:hypothetical protein